MKTFDQLTEEEKVGLTTEQVQYYARLGCANRGIIIPQKPISQVQSVTPATEKYYVVGYESFAFSTEADAQNYIDSKAKSFKIATIGSDYNNKNQYVGVPMEDYKEIKTVILYTKEEATELKDILKANSDATKEWGEYNKSLEEYNKIEEYMWEEIKDINYANSRKEHYNKVYNDYLDLAEGNEKTAYTFFSKAYSTLSLSDIDKEIVDGILSAPTCEETLTA
jgi:hypothetical protein